MPNGKKESKEQELKRLTDYVNVGAGERLEGEKIDLDDVLGEDIKLVDFNVVPSTKFAEEGKKKDFVVLQIERGGKLQVVMTGGGVVVDRIKEMPKNYLPVMIKIVRVKSPESGRKYLSIE